MDYCCSTLADECKFLAKSKKRKCAWRIADIDVEVNDYISPLNQGWSVFTRSGNPRWYIIILVQGNKASKIVRSVHP